ncbi:MAG: adenylyl-sulfate kinase [Lachnospiraceae bacterium]|nr:adenylyl-sulfate kinase [Lachnospiraceae bacterium]
MRNDLLKFITCGSVDDGKSTLIGHMLYDAKLLFADQKKALELDSKVGSADGEIDYSLLLDGLMAEREQGITIDVAYRYFTTDNRSFIVADTPGHEEYTRNMAVGASFASLSVILVDASQGVLVQTRRHARICNLMGIEHFVFAVNKMDLVNYSEEQFKKIKKDIKILMAEFDYKSMTIIPLSATKGDNVTVKSEHMPWYKKETLLEYLENVDVSEEESNENFSMPVQRVCRPNHEFRGFQGQISSGSISVGDTITVLPSKETAKVTEILQGDKNVETSGKGRAVTICLDTEIDISRGCVLEKDYPLRTGSLFAASILWMDDKSLVAGRNFMLKIGTQQVPATIMNIKYKIDVNSGEEVYAEAIYKNEIAFCEISVGSKIVFDQFKNNRELGSLLLIDRITNMTSACGVVEHELARDNNLLWHDMDITKELREKQLNQKACTLWLTGLSGAGKSTIANELEKRLFAMGKHTMLLDGDNVRMGLNKNLGFGEKDRIENIRRIAEVSKLMNDAGLIVLTSFISPYRLDRRNAKDIIGEGFVEIYVSTPIEECERRDVKGLYKAARAGKLADFTGVSSPYEAPENPYIVVDTSVNSVEECVDIILSEIKTFLE